MHPYCMTRVYQQITARPWAIVKAEAEQEGQHRYSLYIDITNAPAVCVPTDTRLERDPDSYGDYIEIADGFESITFAGSDVDLQGYFDEAERQHIFRNSEIETIELYVDCIWHWENGKPKIDDVFFHGTSDSLVVMLEPAELLDMASAIWAEVAA